MSYESPSIESWDPLQQRCTLIVTDYNSKYTSSCPGGTLNTYKFSHFQYLPCPSNSAGGWTFHVIQQSAKPPPLRQALLTLVMSIDMFCNGRTNVFPHPCPPVLQATVDKGFRI